MRNAPTARPNSEKIRWAVLDGRVYDAMTLDEVAPRQRKREPFFWEVPAGDVGGRPR